VTAPEGALEVFGNLLLDNGRPFRDQAVGEQWEVVRELLDPDSATPFTFWVMARGWGKTTIEAGCLLLAMLMLPARSRCYWLARDRDQGRIGVDSAGGFVARNRPLQDEFRVDGWKITALRKDTKLEVLSADLGSAWGLLADLVICDELCQWPDSGRRLFEAVTTGMAKRPKAKLAIVSTPSDPSHWSHSIYRHGLRDPAWKVVERTGPPPWVDPAKIEEQARRLGRDSALYRRTVLGEWAAGEGRLLSAEDLAAAVVLDGPQPPDPRQEYIVAIDLGLGGERRGGGTGDRSVAVVAHAERTAEDGSAKVIVTLDQHAVWKGSAGSRVELSEVREWVEAASKAYNRAPVRFDGWQAVLMCEELKKAGVDASYELLTQQAVGKVAAALHLLIRDRALRLPPDEELLAELGRVRLIEKAPGIYRMDADAGAHDDMAFAVGLACRHLLERHSLVGADVGAVGRGISFANEDLWRPSPWDDGSGSMLGSGWRI
jgi:hypothetical protein